MLFQNKTRNLNHYCRCFYGINSHTGLYFCRWCVTSLWFSVFRQQILLLHSRLVSICDYPVTPPPLSSVSLRCLFMFLSRAIVRRCVRTCAWFRSHCQPSLLTVRLVGENYAWLHRGWQLADQRGNEAELLLEFIWRLQQSGELEQSTGSEPNKPLCTCMIMHMQIIWKISCTLPTNNHFSVWS